VARCVVLEIYGLRCGCVLLSVAANNSFYQEIEIGKTLPLCLPQCTQYGTASMTPAPRRHSSSTAAMAYTYRVATLNINGISSVGRLRMLEKFLRKKEIDILLLQEFVIPDLDMLNGYAACVNVRTDMRGTAMVVKDPLTLTNAKKLPSGRGLAAPVSGVWFVNVYAPSGAERKRESFYNVDLTSLLRTLPHSMILGETSTACLTQLTARVRPTEVRPLRGL
jgi:hypothetical protein